MFTQSLHKMTPYCKLLFLYSGNVCKKNCLKQSFSNILKTSMGSLQLPLLLDSHIVCCPRRLRTPHMFCVYVTLIWRHRCRNWIWTTKKRELLALFIKVEDILDHDTKLKKMEKITSKFTHGHSFGVMNHFKMSKMDHLGIFVPLGDSSGLLCSIDQLSIFVTRIKQD